MKNVRSIQSVEVRIKKVAAADKTHTVHMTRSPSNGKNPRNN